MNVQGRRVDGHAEAERPGDFWWLSTPSAEPNAGLAFLCPGCGVEHGVTIKPFGTPGWDWNGDRERPTLSPSIQVVSHGRPDDNGCRWHGWLRNGEWVSV